MPPTATDTSSVCSALSNRFLGLPDGLGSTANAPLAGRWWVRSCKTDVRGAELRVRLEGPGWFWVDRDDGSFRVRQNVFFRVSADLVGRFEREVAWHRGVVSLWFRPENADVRVEPLGELRPQAKSPLLALLATLSMPIPRWNVQAQARAQLEREASHEFESALERGYTLLYDVERGQPDFALDLLPAGRMPEHPFGDAQPWLANERLLLAPGALHVLGPFEPSEALALDVRVESGPGIAYRAVCATDLRRALGAAERGDTGRIPSADVVDTGSVQRSESARVRAPDCGFYLVLSTSSDARTDADVRLRG